VEGKREKKSEEADLGIRGKKLAGSSIPRPQVSVEAKAQCKAERTLDRMYIQVGSLGPCVSLQ
jgi:hypothetical protein